MWSTPWAKKVLSEPTISRVIKEIESVLLSSGKFSLPSKKALYENNGIDLQYILIDATECPKVCVDTGYLVITHLHENSEMPKKKTKLNPLSKEDKLENKKKSNKKRA